MAWKGKTQGSLLGHKIFVFLIRHLGLKIAYLVLRFVALYYLLFSLKSTKSSFHFFREILKYKYFTAWLKVYQNYYIFGQTLIDKVAIMGGIRNKFTINHDGQLHLREIAAQGKGGIFISAHIGNYEVAGHLLNQIKAKINIVMFDAEHEKIKSYFSEIYGERPVNIIPVKDDLSHIFEINKALKNQEIICIHGDRYVEGGKVISTDFLGKEALFPLGPFQLAKALKVPYSYVFAVKETDEHYHFFATPPKVSNGNVEEMVKEYVKEVERMVKNYPEQWFNFYNFWSKNTHS
ncbi:lipid A biosynthesis acyltransferase [Sporocytophaga myxococcoides]|uniref:Lipid A biosynthesis acyltransferase n=1 Tax=Sporocytophaga myxococcoides TaxID=153721 RepID=A0A098LLK0_9BACT|nr:lipid A biosynthesis acyltransferase [Sporocytophaga myxococcoides]GAL87023.1 lipid A biosynthesis acyltransferase [Sporocytophaga myxococcoides]